MESNAQQKESSANYHAPLKNINFYILLFIALCSISFFEPRGITSPVSKTIQLIGVLSVFLLLMLYIIYYRGHLFRIPMSFKPPLIIMTIVVLSSTVYAQYRYDQSILTSIYQSRMFFYFYIYFLMHIFLIRIKDMEKIIFIIGLAAAIIFIIQSVVYPVRIIESKMFFDRNTLRIFMRGEHFRIMAYLIVVNKFLQNRKTINILYLVIFLFVAVLIGSRTTLAFHILIPLLILISQKHIKNRFLLLFTMFGAVAMSAIIFWDIIESMIAVSRDNMQEGTDYVRFMAINFFITDYMTPVSYLTGNSIAHESTEYGRVLHNLSSFKGYYLSDIGMVGTLVKYGAVYVGIWIYLIFQTFFRRIPVQLRYIRHYLLLLILTSFVSYSIFDGGQGGIILGFIFYILDKNDVSAKRSVKNNNANKIILP
jgi:hypothetical protein